ncbi:MAG: sugar phosphate isomerase/epimerase [Saprospiraceae bacterium]|nr:sugar phosphate isomerase/epimerase [Saprospiraceae bacterium]
MKRRNVIKQLILLPILTSNAVYNPDLVEKRLKGFGLQLSTVTPLMAKDFVGTLKLVSDLGYRMVEFSALGYLGRDIIEVKDLLSKYNLKAPVGRVAFDAPSDFMTLPRDQQMKIFGSQGTMESLQKRIKKSVEECKIMNQKYLNIPAILPHVFSDMGQIKGMIEILRDCGKYCIDQGVMLGYHNHNWEFNEIEGIIPFELMLSELDESYFTFQLDTYWIRKAERNLSDMLTNYPGRFSTCHFKDIDQEGDFADVGYGEIDFPAFTKAAIKHGIKYFFVERDSPPDPEQAMSRSAAYLKKMKY